MNTVTVYTIEAHARNEWRLQGSVMVDQPRTTPERVAIARRFQEACSWRIPIWVDPPEQGNPFEALFAPWPLRFYLVHPDRMLAYIAHPVGETYDLVELEHQIKLLVA